MDRKKLTWSLFIVFIMVFSAFGVIFYGFSAPETKLQYNEHKFTVTEKGFKTKVGAKTYTFGHYPQDLERISLDQGVIDWLKTTKMVYLTYNENQSTVGQIAAAQFEFQKGLKDAGIFGIVTMTKENQYGLPVITCDNATSFVPVFEFREANETQIVEESSCIILEAGYGEDYYMLTDRILYGILGIMQ
ncbi:MAG: hypothetical protein ABIF10_08495 [Candidatus Woesearchaeota archaeon]